MLFRGLLQNLLAGSVICNLEILGALPLKGKVVVPLVVLETNIL